MIYFPNAKINLGLRILNKREDGFHNIESLFLPINVKDVLEIIPSTTFEFTYSGVEHIAGDNLCVQAYNKIAAITKVPPVQMHLHKNIPIGAGIGGGSADTTFTLLALNKQFDLKLSQKIIFEIALSLGSDCPFFIENSVQYVTGRGEKMEPLNVNFDGYSMVIVNPGIHISTKEAYQNLTIPSRIDEVGLKQLVLNTPIEHWQGNIENDFESYAFKAYPQIKTIKEQLINHGAVYASMTGTGSTVYGLFKKDITVDFKVLFNDYFVHQSTF